jgi:hypothetical protein
MRQMIQRRNRQSLLQLALAAGIGLAASTVHAQSRPMDSDLYCAGFFTTRAIETGLTVQSSEEAGFKNEFTERDFVYLNRGKNTIVNTGGQYMLLRPTVDSNRAESFPGQIMMVKGMGTHYNEVGRIEVKLVNGSHATAEVLRACEEIEPGDIAIPLNARTAPDFKPSKITARFAEPSGKATGVIATAKEFARVVGEGQIVYLNIGSAQGLQPGSYLRIRRPYSSDADYFNVAARGYLDSKGNKQRPMLDSEIAAMPTEVLGEVMVLTAEQGTATAIVTYTRLEAMVGDTVELE